MDTCAQFSLNIIFWFCCKRQTADVYIYIYDNHIAKIDHLLLYVSYVLAVDLANQLHTDSLLRKRLQRRIDNKNNNHSLRLVSPNG